MRDPRKPASGTDLNALRLFCAVARERSYTRAAADSGLPVATVSRRVAALEQQLGAQLLRRTTRRVEPTDAGQLLLERCEPVLASLAQAVDCLDEETGRARGRLRVTLPADLARHWLAPALADFAARHPDIRLELDLTARVVDLVAEGFDLAIRVGEQPDSSLHVRRLGHFSSRLYASPKYLASLPAITAPDQLREANALLLQGRRDDREWVLRHGRHEARVTPAGNLVLNDVGALIEVTAAGAGIALLPEQFVAEELARRRIVAVLPQWTGPAAPVYAVYADRRLPARLRLFLDHLAAATRAARPQRPQG